MENNIKVKKPIDLDSILVNEIGQFGRFQLKTLALIGLQSMLAAVHLSFLFTTAKIKTRCLIPECEETSTSEFAPSWLLAAVPANEESFDGCRRFAAAKLDVITTGVCNASMFDTNVTVPCQRYVYEHTNSIVYDFDLACDEWRRSLVGLVEAIGYLVCLPITGYVSDRWGRKIVILLSSLYTGLLGIVRYWANSYTWFVAISFLNTALGATTFPTCFILALELVGPDYRGLAGTIVSTSLAVGHVLLGLIAWAIPNWKYLTLTLYTLQFITISYIWFIPESVRWYISKSRYEETEKLLKEVARSNRKKLSEEFLQSLRATAEEKKSNTSECSANEPWLILLVFKHKQILLRCIVVPFWWITMTLVYYGLSFNAVNITGNPYVNFMVVSAAEIPGYWMAFLLVKFGRRPLMMGAFFVCAACQIAFVFTPAGVYGASLAVYMIGKCAISVIAMSIYVYTNELFPTRYRSRLFAYSSMIGRIGSITAPLTPAIGEATFKELPFVMFGGFALVSGLTMFLTPETVGASMPNTMDEAENITSNKES